MISPLAFHGGVILRTLPSLAWIQPYPRLLSKDIDGSSASTLEWLGFKLRQKPVQGWSTRLRGNLADLLSLLR
jgi:hypothetical protein